MSLFEDSRYAYRDTFFVFLDASKRPNGQAVHDCLAELGSKYELDPVRNDEAGKFDSISIRSPYDFSAMDITYVEGEEVSLQISDLMDEFKTMSLYGDDHHKLARFQKCNARLDVFHFEQIDGGDSNDELIDPGGLLLVLEKLVELCNGVSLDPQSNTLL